MHVCAAVFFPAEQLQAREEKKASQGHDTGNQKAQLSLKICFEKRKTGLAVALLQYLHIIDSDARLWWRQPFSPPDTTSAAPCQTTQQANEEDDLLPENGQKRSVAN